jgi:D-aminoacyl-tRNA deacylase
MRALVQRVRSAEVTVGGQVTGRIDHGLLVYVGIARTDDAAAAEWIAAKVAALRIFNDEQGKLNRSVQDAGGGILVISNFTLAGDGRKGRRPSFDAAAPPELAQPLHQQVVAALAGSGCPVAEGVFGAHMHVTSEADGPVNMVLDSPAASASDVDGDDAGGKRSTRSVRG